MPDPQTLSGFPPLVPTDTNTIVPGNLDVTQQPTVQNADGTRSTVRSISIEEDGRTILIPTVSPDGRVLSNQDAIDLYHKTGKHLGVYGDEQLAETAAQQIHQAEARRIDTPPQPSGFPQAPPDRLTDAMNRAPGVQPDQAAKIFDLQLKTGLPADVIARNLDQVSTAAAAQGFDAAKFRAESPALASWLQQHPLNAALAQDDLGPLAAVESSVKFAGTAARWFAAGVYKGTNLGTWSILQAVGDELGLPAMSSWAKAWNEHLNYTAQTLAGPTAYDPNQAPGMVAGGLLEGVQTAGALIPATIAGLMGGGEGAVLGLLGAETGAEGVNEARAAGQGRGPALAYGALKSATMALTSKAPTHALLGDLAAEAGLTKTLAHQIVANIPAMQAQTAIDGYNEWAYVHPDRPFGEFVNANAQMQSLIATIAMVGTQTGAAHAINKLVGGLASQRAVEQLGRDSGTSRVAQIAPAKFDEFVQHAADTGHEAFYAPLDTFNEYWQSKGIDPKAKAADLTGDPDAYARATQAGDDLRIPAGKLATALADDPAHHKYFADEMRLAPDIMNGREADEFQKAEQARSTVAPTQETSAIDEVNQRVVDRLTSAGYAPEDAKTNADILARLIGVPALRAGLDPLAVYEQYGLTVTRDALTSAPGATLRGSGQETAARPTQGGIDLADHPLESEPAPPVGDAVSGSGEAGAQYGGVDAVPAVLRDHFNAALGDARAAGFTGSDDTLANAYLGHVESAAAIAEQASVGAEEDDRSWRGLLQAVADAGGVGVAANTGKDTDVGGRVLQGGSKGEVEELLDQFDRTAAKGRKLRKGGRGNAVMRLVGDVAGIRGIVKRTGGQTIDAVLESLHEGGRFQHIESQNDLLGELKRAIHDAHDSAAGRTTPAHAIENILESLLGVTPTTRWWEPAAGAADLLDPEQADEQPLTVNPATSWDVYLRQDLFDMMGDDPEPPVETLAAPDPFELQQRSMERMLASVAKAAGRMDVPPDVQAKIAKILGTEPPAPKVDLLSTGEEQPRLPGDVGDVRDLEIAQPKLGEVRDDFQLTPPEETQASQTSLFQPVYHGSPHRFEEFSLHAIGSGEGSQSYGWGLYFASRREVAEEYRRRLTEATDLEVRTTDGRAFTLPNWVVGELQRHNAGEVIADFEQRVADSEARLAVWKAHRAEAGRGNEGQPWMIEQQLDGQKKILEGARAFAEHGGTISQPGRLFHVELPDDAHYLDWDKPASEQSPEVQAALKALGVEWKPFKPMSLKQWDRWVDGPTFAQWWREDIGMREALAEGQRLAQSATAGHGQAEEDTTAFDRWQAQHQHFFNKGVVDPLGSQIYDGLARSHQEEVRIKSSAGTYGGMRDSSELASKALASQGIGGIRYLDGFSRREGAGSSNFVVFDPKLITVKSYEQTAQPDLDQDALNAWTEQVQQDAGADLIHFDVYLTKQGDLQLGTLAVARGAQRAGLGSRTMERLTHFADAQGRRIVLHLADKGYLAGDTKGTTSRARLAEFYKRFGFVENAGRHKDFTITESMYRDPSGPASTLGASTETAPVEVNEDGDVILPQVQKKAGPRGVLRFGPDRQMNIGLFEGANPTTFIHEAGHLALEVFNDIVDGVEAIAPEARTPPQQQLVEDRAQLFARLGVESREALRADDSKHEEFTELLSRYLLKGEAPSISLRRTFARMRSWLLAFYTSLKPHVQNLTPEVRGIFDRMLATDREIGDAEAEGRIAPMFLTPEAAGMAPEKFALYADKVADASRQSREQLQTRLLGELQREQTREWETRKAEVRGRVEQETWARPVYQALAAMQRGTKPDGTPLIDGAEEATPAKLSRQAIVDQFGKDRLKRLPKPYVYTREGGMSPDAVADLFGFTSGDELLTAVEQAAPMKEVIAHETEKRMLLEHGSLMLDGTIHERARAAVMNDYRDQVLRDELRALAELKRTVAPFEKAEASRGAAQSAYQARWLEAESRLKIAIAEGRKQAEIDQLTDEVRNLRRQARGGAATIRAALIPDAVLKQLVGDRVAAMPIAQLKPETFWAAARRNGTKAVEFAARQDFNNAIASKQQQQIAEKMYRAVADAKDDVETRVRQARQLTSLAAQRRIGKAGHGILEQLNDVLGRYNFAPEARSGRPMREWVESLQGESIPGLDVLPDEVLNDVARPYGTLTYEELQGVTDGIAQLAHLATVVNQVLSAQKAKDFGDERDGLVASLYAKHKIRKVKLEITPADETGRFVADIFASHAKLSTLTLLLDAGEDGGPMWEAITRRANKASDDASARNIKAGTEYDALLSKYYSNRERARFGEQLYIPEIKASLSKEMRLEVLKNYGNATSRDRVLSDPVRKWTADQVQAIIDTLDERDTRYVQDHWDFLNQFWPEIAAKAKRLTGLEPQKVDPLPVRTAFGELRGGYHPLVYDARLDVRAGRAQEIGEAKLAVAGAYLMATTKRGHEKARVAHLSQPIRLEMATTFAHLDQVIHDLTHHEMLIDTTRLLRDRTLAKAIQETKGDIVYQKLARILTDIATGDRAPGGAPSIAEKGATWLRQRSQIAGLAYNVWSGLQQPAGIANGIERVGAKWVAKGMTRWLRDAATMENTAHWISDVSPMMAERLGGRGLTQDLQDVRASMSRKGGWFDKAVRAISGDHLTQQGILDSYMWHIGLAQSVADVPTWLGAYEKEMAANPADEPRAIALADQAILDSQGGSHIKDLAQVQRGGPLLKLWMTFASYSVMILNATARAAIQTDFRSPAALLRFASRMSMLYVVPNLLTEIMRCGVGRANCDDSATFIQRVGGQALNTAMNGVLGVRELTAAANVVVGADTGSHGYEGTASTRLFQTVTNAAIQWHQGKWDEGAERAFFAASGLIFNYPASQVQRSIDGFVALEEGRSSNPFALLVGGPPKEKAQ